MAIWTRTEAKKKLDRLRLEPVTIVFTNGCFDILHRGHIEYLSEARSMGDILIVGLNADESVQRLKGENRPIQSQEDRAIILSALKGVDAVVIFEEDTPAALIKELLPDILVKGGDYSADDVVGSETVLSAGGAVNIIPFRPGHSTTCLLEKIDRKKP